MFGKSWEKMSRKKFSITQFAKKNRILISRIWAVVIAVFIVFSRHSLEMSPWVELVFEVSGLIFIGLGTFGRLWASMYIGGNKTHHLVTEGPYSIVRNPLYFFSFLGALGIGLSSENVYVLLLIVTLFAVCYPPVILAEEGRLLETHREAYTEYKKRVPRFFPKLSLLHEPEVFPVRAMKYRNAFFGAMWFIWFYMILEIVEKFHEMGILPILFRLP